MSDPTVQDVPVAPASSAPPVKGPSKGPSKKPEVGELLVTAAAVALTIGVGVALFKNKKVQEKVEDARGGVSSTVEDVDYKARGARIVGETDSKLQDVGNDVKKSVEDAATEVKKKGKWAFKKATSAVKKSHRGVLIQKGDTLWGLSRQYNVPVEVIKASNTMLGDKIIAGQELVIPGAGMLDEN